MAAKSKTIAPTRPNVGIQAAYQKRIDALVAEMTASVDYWVKAAYRASPPEMAQDASPAMALRQAMRKLARRWQRKFDRLSQEMAEHFATAATERSDKALAASMRKAGFTVRFKATKAQNDAFQAIVGENVSLIKSIPGQYMTGVEGAVLRSVAAGRDLGALSRELQDRHRVTKDRAALIARDQNNKATAVMTRVRQDELGVTEAIWIHSHGGKKPRPSHLAFDGHKYKIAQGAYLDGVWTWPGVEINCRCVSRSIIPGFS